MRNVFKTLFLTNQNLLFAQKSKDFINTNISIQFKIYSMENITLIQEILYWLNNLFAVKFRNCFVTMITTRLQILQVKFSAITKTVRSILRTFLNVWINDNTPAKNCRKPAKNRHIRPPFSPFYLRKCMTNSGRYIIARY